MRWRIYRRPVTHTDLITFACLTDEVLINTNRAKPFKYCYNASTVKLFADGLDPYTREKMNLLHQKLAETEEKETPARLAALNRSARRRRARTHLAFYETLNDRWSTHPSVLFSGQTQVCLLRFDCVSCASFHTWILPLVKIWRIHVRSNSDLAVRKSSVSRHGDACTTLLVPETKKKTYSFYLGLRTYFLILRQSFCLPEGTNCHCDIKFFISGKDVGIGIGRSQPPPYVKYYIHSNYFSDIFVFYSHCMVHL